MTELKMRVWRGDDQGGALQDYTVEVSEGEVASGSAVMAVYEYDGRAARTANPRLSAPRDG